MSALIGRPLFQRLSPVVMLLLAHLLVVAGGEATEAQMPRGSMSPQYQYQPASQPRAPQLRFAGQPTSSQSVLAAPETLAMPLGDPEGANRSRESLTSASSVNAEFSSDALICDASGCDSGNCCSICGDSGCKGCDPWALFPNCTPPGLLQWMQAHHDACGTCWSGQVDAVLFWRNAPPSRELATSVPVSGTPVSALNADQLNSELAGGPRIGIVRKDTCGNAAEFVYLSAGSFRSERSLPDISGSTYSPASIFGATTPTFLQGSVSLGSSFQTFEANSRTRIGGSAFSFISGFRWLEWQEAFSMNTASGTDRSSYTSSVINSLYGGQIGVDAWLLTMPWLKVDSWLKGGAYYNNAVQHTALTSNVPGTSTFTNAVSGSPAAGSFVGEVGINGVVPVSPCVNFRFGYTAFWLESIALATQQLSNQNALATNGGTVLQGVNFGFEGNW
jgi:hypothetical protein